MDAARKRIFVTRRLPREAMEILERDPHIELRVNSEDRGCTRDELVSGFQWADGALTMLSDKIDRELLEVAPRLRVVANYAVGYNNIDLTAANERHVVVTNTPHCLAEATADLTMGLLLAVARRLVEGDGLVRAGLFKGWAPEFLLGMDLHGKTLGIIGLGEIGTCVARRARAFGMRIVYCARHEAPTASELQAERVELPELLRRSDVVSLHCPLTAETKGMLGAAQLAAMKPTAYLINTARGACIDENALIEALRTHAIAGAALDVYDGEPNVKAGFMALKNVVLAPHLGSAATETRVTMGHVAISNILAVLNGGIAPNPVN